jgi:hypothetical protein
MRQNNIVTWKFTIEMELSESEYELLRMSRSKERDRRKKYEANLSLSTLLTLLRCTSTERIDFILAHLKIIKPVTALSN